MRRILACAVAILATPALSSAALLLSDNFESYANTAALGASWTLGPGQTLNTSNGNPGQSYSHPATTSGTTNVGIKNFTEFVPTATERLVFSADIYDDANSANERNSAGIRRGSGANIIEMGQYNSPSHYAYRMVLFAAAPAGASGWFAFTNIVNDLGAPINNAPVQGWHRYTAEISNTSVTFSLDLNSDGIINATATHPITLHASGGFNSVRLGGPSGVSSTNGGVLFDNIRVSTIPEPTTALLAAFGLAAAGFRRR